MLPLLWIWMGGGLASLLAYAAVSFRNDRRFVTSTWINLWLGLMVLLGPVGTVLIARTLVKIVGDVRRETARMQAAGKPVAAFHRTFAHLIPRPMSSPSGQK